MCGIIGSVNCKLALPEITNALLHRGPDEQFGWNDDLVEFYHFRLAILDAAGGKQPMQLGNDYVIIFNGQIYNHRDLRVKFNLQCTTNSDTETILHLYRLIGDKMLDEMDGMFAMAIYNRTNRTIFFARDRAGKKPLYFFHSGRQFAFASELNAIASFIPLEIDHSVMSSYLRLSFISHAKTPYKNVVELPLGHKAIYDIEKDKFLQTQWWSINPFYEVTNNDSLITASKTIDGLLRTAVQRRIDSSDLEVGSFLSGGIDSGLITAYAAQHKPNLRTFTIKFEGQFDESSLAKQVANKYHTNHIEIPISFSSLHMDLENIIANYGEPYADSSAIPSYYVSREARKHVTVILNGEGGDELFGGYRRYVPFSICDFFTAGQGVRLVAKMLKWITPFSDKKYSKLNYLFRLFDMASKSNPTEQYLSATFDAFEGNEKWFLKESDSILMTDLLPSIEKIVNRPISGLKKIMNLDFNIFLFGDLLVKMDIATMANSLEGRSPFLAKEILEYAPTLKDEYKIKGTETKFILRQLAKKYLPPDLAGHPKRGFEIPLKNWVENEIKDRAFDYLLNPNAYYTNFIDPNFVNRLLKKKISISDEKRAKMIWALMCLEIWYKKVGASKN
jgi:asparagine synthase (glutamine-hydrolysing)